MAITKRYLVEQIHKKTALPQQLVLRIVQMTLDLIVAGLAKGQKVELRNFGVFDLRVRKPRIGRNPNRPAIDVPIPKRAVVKFKPGKEMEAQVGQLDTSQLEQQAQARRRGRRKANGGETKPGASSN